MEKFKLISMTDFVLGKNQPKQYIPKEKHLSIIAKYAEFLSEPLVLGMFVPCDENGNVLKEPSNLERMQAGWADYPIDENFYRVQNYDKAQKKVLFKDATITPVEDYYIVKIGKREVWITWTERTIEDVQHINRAYEVDFELTESAINQLGL